MDGTVTINKALQRSRGAAGLSFRDGDLARLHQRGAAKALLPRTHSNTHEAVLVNTAGGITGGDRYDYQCEAAASRVVVTCLLYTSPSPRDMRRSRMPSSA